MVIAIPTPLGVQGNDEQIRLFDILEGVLPGSRGVEQDGVTKGATKAVEYGCLQ
jgi:hypothetical protein